LKKALKPWDRRAARRPRRRAARGGATLFRTTRPTLYKAALGGAAR